MTNPNKFDDIINKQFGLATVLRNSNNSGIKVVIKCQCGFEKEVSGYDVRANKVKSCGRAECSVRKTDIRQKCFGSLVAMYWTGEFWKNSRNPLWYCSCKCGNYTTVPYSELVRGHTTSCGCKDNVGRKLTLPLSQGAIGNKYSAYKAGAVKRELEWRLSFEEFRDLIMHNCFYCGTEPPKTIYTRRIGSLEIRINGVDRKDNGKGYLLDNCVACCSICNVAKNDLPFDEFMNWIHRIIKYQTRKDPVIPDAYDDMSFFDFKEW